MILSIIAAMSRNRVIGRQGIIPWDIPSDRRRFRMLTMGHPVIMGRKTFESIGNPLSGRQNIVITRQPDFRPPDCIVVHDLSAALYACGNAREVFVCGGEEIYRQMLPLADRIYLTIVHRECEGDTAFPLFSLDEFVEIDREEVLDEEPHTYLTYRREPT